MLLRPPTRCSRRRDAGGALDAARATQGALVELQGASERHWQVTRGGREEMQQLVKAVRALLMDSEMRVANEEEALAATARAHSRLAEFGHNLAESTAASQRGRPVSGSRARPPRSPPSALTTTLYSAAPSPPPQPHSTGTPWSRRRQVLAHAAGETMGDGDYASTVPILPAATQSLRPLVGSPRG